jgi:hypothetical protein
MGRLSKSRSRRFGRLIRLLCRVAPPLIFLANFKPGRRVLATDERLAICDNTLNRGTIKDHLHLPLERQGSLACRVLVAELSRFFSWWRNSVGVDMLTLMRGIGRDEAAMLRYDLVCDLLIGCSCRSGETPLKVHTIFMLSI